MLESFAIKCPIDYSTNELWKSYINWFNSESGLSVGGNGPDSYYGIDKKGEFDYSESTGDFKVIKPFSYISEILNLEQGLKIGDWINIINEPIDGSRPPNWHPDMNKYFGTWQQVVNFVAGKPWVDGSWCIEHSNYTEVKSNGEYIRDVVSETVLTPDLTRNPCAPRTDFENLKEGDWVFIKNYPDGPPTHWNSSGEMKYLHNTWQQVIKLTSYILIDCSKKSVSDVWSLRMEDIVSYLTDEKYKAINKLSDTSTTVESTTSKLIEDWHNAQYAERQKFIDENIFITPNYLPKYSKPLTPSECFQPILGTKTKTTANLIATKPVKVTGYKYVNLKNK